MKLKSKLITTIASMCAAIAVIGVGVWASTVQKFTVTVNNDIDVKIMNINADVYGEFSVYTQFLGQVVAKETPKFAQRYGKTEIVNYNSHEGYDRGYLLYAKAIGLNDGQVGKVDEASDYQKAEGDFGYQNYINYAKDNVFLATENATLENDNPNSTNRKGPADSKDLNYGKADYSKIYNVDESTHTAQVAYMYTIKQWGITSETAPTNAIKLNLSINLSNELNSRLVGMINSTTKKADAQLRIHAFILHADETNATWRRVGLTEKEGQAGIYGTEFYLPKYVSTQDLDNQTYYFLITYTFGRNDANLDLSSLRNALNHTLELNECSGINEADVNAKTYKTTGVSEATKLAKATGGDPVKGVAIQGSAWAPEWAHYISETKKGVDRILNSTDAETLKTESITHLPEGYIYEAKEKTEGGSTALESVWTWLSELNKGGQSDTSSADGVAIIS